MAGLNTKTGQRNATYVDSRLSAANLPQPRQVIGGGSSLEKKGNFIDLKAKPNTSSIKAERVAEDYPGLDAIRRKLREDAYFDNQMMGSAQTQSSGVNQLDALFKSRLDANKAFVSNEANMNLTKTQLDAVNLNNTRDNNTRLQQSQIDSNANIEVAKVQDGANLRDFYAKNLQSMLGYGASVGNQNYEYWK